MRVDTENRVVSASNGSSSGTYTFDGNSLRVEKVSGSTTTVYIFSGSKVVAEYDNGAAPSSPSREYIYSGGVLLAKIASGTSTYYHQDHLSNRLVTDSSGTVAEQLGTYPFGESWYNTTSEKWLFTTYERDPESQNDYAMARSYVNRVGRFSSPDLLGGLATNPQSLNRYAYVTSDPVSLVDPLGLDSSPCPVEIAPGVLVPGFCTTGSAPFPRDGLGGGSDNSPPPLIYAGGSKGGGGKVAATNGTPTTPWYKNPCVTSALGTGALSLGVDAIGLIPEAGGVARMIGHGAGYVGVVADQAGTRVVKAVGASTSTVQGLRGLFDTSPTGLLSTGLTIAGFIPGAGQVASIGSIIVDTYKTAKAIGQCH